MPVNFTEDEEKILILKKISNLLLEQKQKFINYLNILNLEKSDIEGTNIEALAQHVVMEEASFSELYNFQSIINSFKKIYREKKQSIGLEYELKESAILEKEISKLNTDINDLQNKLSLQSRENQKNLKLKIEDAKKEIEDLKTKSRKLFGLGNNIEARNNENGLFLNIYT